MKKTFIIGVIALMSANAQAIVADKFSCELMVTDFKTKTSATQRQELYVARLPLSFSPASDVRITAAETHANLTLETTDASLSANLTFYYKHAVKINGNGKPLEARQFSCFDVSPGYCDKNSLCFKTSSTCSESLDPFDPINGWSITTLISDVPAFNMLNINPTSVSITDNLGNTVGSAIVQCQSMGTYW